MRVPDERTLEFTRPSHHTAQLLRNHYGIRAEACARMRTVFAIVEDGELRYVWKPLSARTNVASLPTVSRLAQRLVARGIPVASPLPMRDGTVVCCSNPQGAAGWDCGYLQVWMDGRHVSVTHRQERLGAIAIISAMHDALGARSLSQADTRVDTIVGTAAARLLRRHRQLGFTQLPLDRKIPLKQAFLRSVLPVLAQSFPQITQIQDVLLKSAEAAVSALSYANQVGTERVSLERRIAWCHRDVAPHNLLWQDHVVGLIDFDQSAWDDPLGDAVQFLNHVLHSEMVTGTEWFEVLDMYSKLARLSTAEHWRLEQLARFPDVLARAAAEWWRDRATAHRAARVEWAIGREQRRLLWYAERSTDGLL